MPDEHRTHPPGTVLDGKFEVVRLIGAGGMGAVYEVRHRITKHRRALKLLLGGFSLMPTMVERFLREASAAGRIGNPHIVETHDAGHLKSGEPYIVMEFLEGQSLADCLEREKWLDPVDAVDIVSQACRGVGAAHDVGIVHRDLKPDNLFLLSRETRPFVKVLDFGISKFDPALTGVDPLTREGAPMGTAFYMPPEQARGGEVDVRADVYSLGVVLYECITGRKPFVADTLPAIIVLIHEGQYPAVRDVRPEIPPELAAVTERAMAKDPQHRFESINEFSAALAALKLGHTARTSKTALLHTQPLDDGPPASSQHLNDERASTRGGLASAETAGEGVERGAPQESKRTPYPLMVAAAVLVGVAAVAVAGGSAMLDTSGQAPAGVVPETPVLPAVESANVPTAVGASAASSMLPPPKPTSTSRQPAATAVKPGSTAPGAETAMGSKPTHKEKTRPNPKPETTSTSRAEEHGLAEENPL